MSEICKALKVQEKVVHTFFKLGMPHRVINGRYYAHRVTVDLWLQHFLNPHASRGPVEIRTDDAEAMEAVKSFKP
jgi:GrpB-like predicted nucleotidyltransferase (UPF0157 family)